MPQPKIGFTRAATCARCQGALPLQPAYAGRAWPYLYCSKACLEVVTREVRAIGAALHGLPGTGGAL